MKTKTTMRDKSERPLILAAMAWWRSKCPVGFDQKQHLENPTINTYTEAEKRLARVIAERMSSK